MSTRLDAMDDGLRPAKREQRRRTREKLERELGPLVFACLSDPEVLDVILNPDGVLWVERLGRPPERLGKMHAVQAEALISTVASEMRAVVTAESPILECELSIDGSRFSAVIPPVVSSPCFAIRRRAGKILKFIDYVASGIMTGGQATRLAHAIEERRNILIAGGTGSGKTTLANALIAHMAERLATSAEGRMQALQVANQIAPTAARQTQKLRQIMLTQIWLQAMYIQTQADREAAKDAAWRNFNKQQGVNTGNGKRY